MDSSSSEIAIDMTPLLIVYKDGHVERLQGTEIVPPSLDPTTGVESKDVLISKHDIEDMSARIFIPKINDPTQKLPLLVYFHGGGFCVETPFSPTFHNYLNSLVSQAHVIGVSVNYRRAPEHPVPITHEDSWTALKWIASHSDGNGPDDWLNRYADFGKVFFAGDSAGANISHHLGIRVGQEGFPGLKLEGIALVHPYFWGVERIGSEGNQSQLAAMTEKLWRFAFPTMNGFDDPLVNPAKDPNLGSLGARRVIITVAELDLLKDRGWYYKEVLVRSGWPGVVEDVMEAKGEGHVFHLYNPDSENAIAMLNRIASFINRS